MRWVAWAVLLAVSCGGVAVQPQPPPVRLDERQVTARYLGAVARGDWAVAHGCLDPGFDRLATSAPDSDFNNLLSLGDVQIGDPYPALGVVPPNGAEEAVEVVVTFRAQYKRTITVRSGRQTRFVLLSRTGPDAPWLIFGIGSGPYTAVEQWLSQSAASFDQAHEEVSPSIRAGMVAAIFDVPQVPIAQLRQRPGLARQIAAAEEPQALEALAYGFGEMKVRVRAHPGATRSRTEWRDEVLHIWVTAQTVDGAANRALIQVVAEVVGVRAGRVRLVAGMHSRQKLFEVGEA